MPAEAKKPAERLAGRMIVDGPTADSMENACNENACNEQAPRGRVIFDREHVFEDGMRMLVQVVESLTAGQSAWTQGVLIDPAGNELASEGGESFLGDYELEHDGFLYSLSVERGPEE